MTKVEEKLWKSSRQIKKSSFSRKTEQGIISALNAIVEAFDNLLTNLRPNMARRKPQV